MILTIYNNKSDKRVVDKNIEQICQMGSLQMRNDFDIRNGSIDLDTSTINLYNPDNRAQNKYINQNGSLQDSNNFDTTDFIYSQGYTTISYEVLAGTASNCFVCYYDPNYNFVTRAAFDPAIGTINLQWSGYFRFCINKIKADPLRVMINRGGEALAFVPFTTIDLSRANYCYIDELDRYYYIADVTADGRTGRWRLNLKCDVLMTFKDGIRALRGTVDRQQNLSNGYIPDGEYKELAYSQITAKSFPNGMTNDNLILMTVG